MAIKKSQLYSTLWESCNALRGSMDASQYKDYVLMILFVKYLSDKANQGQIRLKVPEGCCFEDFVLLKQNPHIGELINEKLEAIREANAVYIGDLTLPNFNDDSKLGTGKTKVETLSKLIGEFERDELNFSLNRTADDDLLGDAYEYLMKNFAAESGKSKGQFYTPGEVSRVMAKVLHLEEFARASNTIYDMTCGSGSLLLRALSETHSGKPTLYGQEKDSTTASLAKLNMLLHGIISSNIKVGDTLHDPKFTHTSMLQTFDVCVANPPFSIKNWLTSGAEDDLYNRWNKNILPPAKCGDFAFLLHLIASMHPDTGRGACILPHGVLFRGNAEYTIRKHIIDKHYIKGIIGLPANLFFGTGIPACIIIVDKKDAELRNGIFIIDAKDGYMKDGNKNRLREQDIKRIVDAWNAQDDIPHYARMVSYDEISNPNTNDYNLNIPRYIQPQDTEILQNITAHLHGGLPKHNIDQLDEYWKVCTTLKDTLFRNLQNEFYSLNVSKEDIASSIEKDISFLEQQKLFHKSLKTWSEETRTKMLSIGKESHPKKLIADWSERLFVISKADKSLMDAYSVYDKIMNYWAEIMQDDCYMIANDGWTLPKDIRPTKKNGIYSDIQCNLLPIEIVLSEYFAAELSVISNVKEKYDELCGQIDSLVDDNTEAFEDFEKVNESTVKSALKDNMGDSSTIAIWKEYLSLCKKKKDTNAELSKLHTSLTEQVVEKYADLTEDEIKRLVVDKKWISTIVSSCEDEMNTITNKLTSEITALVERYEKTLSALTKTVIDCENEVKGYLTEMGFNF